MSKIIIFSGAGISAESGVSTFRDAGGLWEKHRIEDICSAGCLATNRDATLDFYDARRLQLAKVKPNHAHEEVAKISQKYPNDIAVITQNVDDLFERAGCKNVMHLHGFLTSIKCENCEYKKDIGYSKQNRDEKCPECGSLMRPDIVFFGEAAPMYQHFMEELNDCELFIAIGTSGTVINLNMFVGYIKYSILNNLEPSNAIIEEYFTKVLYKPATKAIDEIVEDIEHFISCGEI